MQTVLSEPFGFFKEPSEFVKENLCYSDGMGIESHGNFRIDRDFFENYVLMYVKEGDFFHEQKGERFHLTAGDYVFADLREPHLYYFAAGMPGKIYWAHLNGRVVREIARCIQNLHAMPFCAHSPEMERRLLHCFLYAKEGLPDPFRFSRMLYGILTAVLEDCRNLRERGEETGDGIFERRVEEVLQSFIYRRANLQLLADAMYMSKYYFCHMYREKFGDSPMKRLTEEKIRTAQMHLRYTSDKIENIARQLAFSSPGYFSRVFREQVGMTPAEYRESVRQGRLPEE